MTTEATLKIKLISYVNNTEICTWFLTNEIIPKIENKN